MVTFAFGTAAPLASVMTPRSIALVGALCEKPGVTTNNNASSEPARTRNARPSVLRGGIRNSNITGSQPENSSAYSLGGKAEDLRKLRRNSNFPTFAPHADL